MGSESQISSLETDVYEKEIQLSKIQDSKETDDILKEKEDQISCLQVEIDEMKNYLSHRDIEFKKIEVELKESLEEVSREKSELILEVDSKNKKIESFKTDNKLFIESQEEEKISFVKRMEEIQLELKSCLSEKV